MISIASVWEMQIKLQLGKLKLNLPLADIIASQRQTNGIQLLPIALNHVLELRARIGRTIETQETTAKGPRLARSYWSYVNGFWPSPSNRQKENAYQTNALSLQSHTVSRSCASLRGTRRSNKENVK